MHKLTCFWSFMPSPVLYKMTQDETNDNQKGAGATHYDEQNRRNKIQFYFVFLM